MFDLYSSFSYQTICCFYFIRESCFFFFSSFCLSSLPHTKDILVALVCVSVCKQQYSNRYKPKFYEGARGGTKKNSLNFGGNLGLLR